MEKQRLIVRIETVKNTYEFNKPIFILPDAPSNKGLIFYISSTGSDEGDYLALLRQSRKATSQEIYDACKKYGLSDLDYKIVSKLKNQ